MIFFGWGRKSKTQQVTPDQALLLTYSYFHLFWLFRITVPKGYALATRTEAGWAQRPLEAHEVEATGAATALTVHWWWRWGLLVLVGALVAMSAVAIATSETTV